MLLALSRMFLKKKCWSMRKNMQENRIFILLAQGSMSYCEEFLRDKLGKAVVSSPSFGARALKEALVKKGAVK